MTPQATAFAPGSIGNVGPGFDVLGLAVEGLGDKVTVELVDGPSSIVSITGVDAGQLPREAEKNAAATAALAMLRQLGCRMGVRLSIEKGLPLSGGLGGSAASSVAGALAAALAAQPEKPVSREALLEASLAGESSVAGRHLDNIAPAVLGGLALVRSVDPVDAVSIPVAADWHLALVTPAVRVETRAARALLPPAWERSEWVAQMAHTAALVWAFSQGDVSLARRALQDRYAEPRRAGLIPHFHEAKKAALDAGAIGCSISGSGPTLFALTEDKACAERCAAAMQKAFAEVSSRTVVTRIAREGAHRV